MGKSKEPQTVTLNINVGTSSIIPSSLQFQLRQYGSDWPAARIAEEEAAANKRDNQGIETVGKRLTALQEVTSELSASRIKQLEDINGIIDSCIIDYDSDTGAFRDDLKKQLQQCVDHLTSSRDHFTNSCTAVSSFVTQYRNQVYGRYTMQ